MKHSLHPSCFLVNSNNQGPCGQATNIQVQWQGATASYLCRDEKGGKRKRIRVRTRYLWGSWVFLTPINSVFWRCKVSFVTKKLLTLPQRDNVKLEHVLEVSEKDKCQTIWPREVRQPAHEGSRGVNNLIVFMLTIMPLSA